MINQKKPNFSSFNQSSSSNGSSHETQPHKPHHFFIRPLNKNDFTYALIFFISILITSIVVCNFVSPFYPHILPFNFSKTLSNTSCDYSYGKWVWDETYPTQKYNEDCPFLDPGFRCRRNGRPDSGYVKWQWQPHGSDLPRFNARDFLERSRNGRIVFAGDSIGRNQWESLLCMLSQGVSNTSTIYEEHGNPITKHKGFLSIMFHDYNLTIQYYRVPFLVVIDDPPENAPKEVQRAVRVDKLHRFSLKWAGADVLVFSAGHWWNQDKTIKMGWYFQEEGALNMKMDVMEAFGKSLQTLKSWAYNNCDPQKTHIFFRSFSPVHYRGGEWNKGGQCDRSKEPETSYINPESEPLNNKIIMNVVKEMEATKRKVKFLNISYLTTMRKDGHPSRYHEPGTRQPSPQDFVATGAYRVSPTLGMNFFMHNFCPQDLESSDQVVHRLEVCTMLALNWASNSSAHELRLTWMTRVCTHDGSCFFTKEMGSNHR